MAGTKNTHPHPPHTRATPKNTGHPNTRATPKKGHPHRRDVPDHSGRMRVLMPQNPNSVLDPHPRTQHE
jgi:hypothetical protein